MREALIRTARERYTLRHFATIAVTLGVVYWFSGDWSALVGVGVAFAITEPLHLLQETPGADARWSKVVTGGIVTVGSLAWLGYEATAASAEGVVWLPALMTLAGVWFLLDARRDFAEGRRRDDGGGDDVGPADVMLVLNHAHLVVESLKEGPKTVGELAADCDLTESRVRDALDVGTRNDTVYRVESDSPDEPDRYALDESNLGGAAFVRKNGNRLVRRLVRPFRR